MLSRQADANIVAVILHMSYVGDARRTCCRSRLRTYHVPRASCLVPAMWWNFHSVTAPLHTLGGLDGQMHLTRLRLGHKLPQDCPDWPKPSIAPSTPAAGVVSGMAGGSHNSKPG